MGLYRSEMNSLILVALLLAIVYAPDQATLAESRTLPMSPSPSRVDDQGISKVFATLGVVCKCCNRDGDCTGLFNEGSCFKVQCLPWKLS